ncbi:Tn3 family transposase [Nonomuraea typhae]|uniref:Tn3 family transposase n=1 Tax=Nonomuraea typhae TaxID=2603600 RepID=UPI003CCD31F8
MPAWSPTSPSQTPGTAEWYVREETLRAANMAIIDCQQRMPLAPFFDGGTVSSSDGQSGQVRRWNAVERPVTPQGKKQAPSSLEGSGEGARTVFSRSRASPRRTKTHERREAGTLHTRRSGHIAGWRCSHRACPSAGETDGLRYSRTRRVSPKSGQWS